MIGPWQQYLPSAKFAWETVRAHWLKGLAMSAGVFVLIAAITFALPRTYYSEAKIFVKAGWPSLSLDPTATTGQTVSIYETRETEINSILEMLRSRQVTEGVIRTVGLEALLHGSPVRTSATPDAEVYADATLNRAITALEKQMQIWTPKRSNVIIVRCEADSPALAQAVVQAYLSVYKNVHAEVNQTKGSYNFFAEQGKVLRKSWQDAAANLRDAKDKLGIATLAARRTMLESQLADVEQKLLGAEAEVAASTGKIESLTRQLASVPKFTETLRSENASAGADLYRLQIREKELAARFTDQHPQVLELRDQIAALEKTTREAGKAWTQSTSGLNPAWSQIEASLLSEKSSLDAINARTTSLTKQKAELLADLRKLNADEIQITQLQQTVDVAEKSYLETAQRTEQARIQQQLADERITNVNVFQDASFVDKAIAPKRSVILALGVFLAGLCGAATIAGFGYLKQGVLTLEAIASQLQLPVVATLRPQAGLRPAL